jgi:uncharacterized membrane protein YebE (DUF533 family)
MTITPGRIATGLTALAALCGGLAPVVADLDWESTAGIIGGISAITAIVYKWLDGWQKYEARQPVDPEMLQPAQPVPPSSSASIR